MVGEGGMDMNGGENDGMELNDNDVSSSVEAAFNTTPPRNTTTGGQMRSSNAVQLNLNWKRLLPTLLDSLVLYRDRTVGKADPLPVQVSSCCSTGNCIPKQSKLRCYSFYSHRDLTVPYCECCTLPQVLVQNGLFPASPSRPQTAFTIDLLDFYQILWRYSCDAITSFSSSLAMMYSRRGFTLCNQTGGKQHDPIRKPLGFAVQWFDCLQVMLDREMSRIIDECKPTPSPSATLCEQMPSSTTNHLPTTTETSTPALLATARPASYTQSPPIPSVLLKEECATVLQRLCPACFGGDEFGRSFDDGGDIHVALDGNLHHRQLVSAGEGVPFYDSERFLSKLVVDEVGERVAAARKKPAKRYTPQVPDESIDQCRESYYAARGESKHAASEMFRERGLMGLVCRHDVPLFVASIDTPGEQQKYSIALLETLFSLLPSSATVLALYDIGCVLDRSMNTDYFSRLQLATSVMHAYGHQWPCQLRFNPHLKPGLGLTDGEGTERLWAALRKLIGPERQSSAARRKWLLDRALQHLAEERQQELGTWMTTKLHDNIEVKEAEAEKMLLKVCVPVEELRVHWEQQKEAQTSVRSHAPIRLKKELGKVLKLQSEVEALEETIVTTKHAVKHLPSASADAIATLPLLESAHAVLKSRSEDLYLSLNISEGFPELKNVPFEYLQLLLLARDLKINVRKRCIGSFFEWDKLDRAVGGRDFALGTKAHQLTRKSISKRAPALQSAIKKYNQYVDKLKALHKPSYAIPIPRSLPVELAALRDPESSYLWEDVWIARSDSEAAPLWLVDESVRSGIRAMLTLDRCREERVRLESEASNMCKWYGHEFLGIEKAYSSEKYQKYKTIFNLLLLEHSRLALRWVNPYLSLSQLQGEVLRLRNITPSSTTFAATSSQSPGILASMSPGSTDSTLVEEMYDEVGADEFDLGDDTADHYLAEVLDGGGADDDDDDREDDKQREGQAHTPNHSIKLIWEVPSDLPIDSELLPLSKSFPHWAVVGGMSSPHVISSTFGARHVFMAGELVRMDSSTCRLCAECVNGCAAILQELLAKDLSPCGTLISSPHTVRDVAIFSTYLVPKVFSDIDNAAVWRLTRSTQYWNASTWILPIHDEDLEHWILAVICLKSSRILLFDSMGSESIWEDWLPKINTVINRLFATASEKGHTVAPPSHRWIARPLTVQRLQLNGHDCGVWILFVMAAVLRGKNIPDTTEKEIKEFRSLLARLIRYLPQMEMVSASDDSVGDFTIL
ncbi:hypothetical protein E1B28_012810 [Marasmius oreades]|uniref:Ubiquitin-like protease family profile domain-containing protein n=1 Tax=Marasmius oreades TaxID=181124 RepID=A0A9P7RS96_9AGAR|nr:uncharacterized protein E1B28_012810 [Marasmius oreades]KAG7088856.1 hypothetical protein E1B28_012810 [Marasmius oreades]